MRGAELEWATSLHEGSLTKTHSPSPQPPLCGPRVPKSHNPHMDVSAEANCKADDEEGKRAKEGAEEVEAEKRKRIGQET